MNWLEISGLQRREDEIFFNVFLPSFDLIFFIACKVSGMVLNDQSLNTGNHLPSFYQRDFETMVDTQFIQPY